MKKATALLLVLSVLACALVSCRSNTSEAGAPAAQPATQPASENNSEGGEQMKIAISVNGHDLSATLEDNSSASALMELLKKGDITVSAHDYGGFEKVGDLPQSLPRNDESINTSPGDIILYLGSSICFYYGTNSWNFTRLGRIDGAENLDIKAIYGNGNATFVLSAPGK